MQYPTKSQIREILRIRHNETEFKELCEVLSVPYSQLSGNSQWDKAFELIEYMERRGGLEKLWNAMIKYRPDLVETTPPDLPSALLYQYFENQIEELKKVDFGGYVAGIRLTANLDSIFIDPTLTEPTPLKPVIGLNRLDLLDKRPSISWRELLDYGKRQVIIGGLGSGKTCLLKQIFLQTAKESINKLQSSKSIPQIPIYLPLRYLQLNSPPSNRRSVEAMVKLIEKRFPKNVSWSQLKEFSPSILLLADGLDEIPEEMRQAVVVMFNKLLKNNPTLTVVITLRSDEFKPELFNPEDKFLLSSIRPMSQGEQGDLIRNLFRETQIATTLNSATLIDVANIVTSRSLSEIMTAPLSVVVGVLSYMMRPISSELATTVIRERLIKLFLGEWDNLKAIQEARAVQSDTLFSTAEVACYLAYEVLNRSGEANVTQTEVSIDIATKRYVQLGVSATDALARRDVLGMMNILCKRSGLLDCSGGTFRARNYRFRHKHDVTLMVAIYFAEQIPSEARKQLLSERITLPSWKSVILVVFDLLFLRSQTEANEFINYLIQENNILENQLTERLYLAARCLVRLGKDIPSSTQRVIEKILLTLQDKRQLVDLDYRIKLAEILGQLGDPRIGKVVTIPEGEFFMGYDLFPNDRPVRKLRLPTFQIDAYPVVNAQFKQFIDDNGYQRKEFWDKEGWEWILETGRRTPKYWSDSRFNKPNYPVVGVSWFEADAFARWAGKRLPTEAEWEKMARGTEEYYWPWGSSFNENNLNCSDSAVEINGTTPIGVYPAGQSPFGVFDTAGNVSEWTANWYEPYDSRQSPEDSHYGERFKVRRGGGWGWDQDFARCACRGASPRTADYAVIGFRCAM
ncbi:MAG: SUMF1/EgtB/PvdO family nonheme iron enzyme [Planctomycetes bacterium]|nr:SUMF1/EgtB/PvdO family nonheme iron enzyme [Planctomycetota bacterium]